MSSDYGSGSGQSSGNWAPPPPWANWGGWSNWGNPQSRSAPPPPNVRIGDAERTEMVEALSRHFAEGRLDEHEMRERVEKATAAKTRADLSGLLSDLPPLQSQHGPAPVSIQRRRHRFLVYVLVAFVAISIAGSLAAPWHFPWFLFFIFAFLMFRRGGWWHHHHHHRGDWNRSTSMY